MYMYVYLAKRWQPHLVAYFAPQPLDNSTPAVGRVYQHLLYVPSDTHEQTQLSPAINSVLSITAWSLYMFPYFSVLFGQYVHMCIVFVRVPF